ncbi:MAG: hypothetical protein ACFB4I_06370 [Cyanophyceae cyanobacterium]
MTRSLLSAVPLPSTVVATDKRLQQYLLEIQQYDPETQAWQATIEKLVKEILRSRSICRPLGSRGLLAVQEEIYEQMQQELRYAVQQALPGDSRSLSLREWSHQLQQQATRKVLNDAQLKKLALAAQGYPPDTPERRHLLGELVEAIQSSGRLCRPHRGKFSEPSFYELLYEEAVLETLAYVCKNIDKYDPQRGQKQKFMTWVNFRLDKLVIESRRRFSDHQTFSLPTLSDLDRLQPPQEAPLLSELVRQCIEEDAENTFKQAQIRNRPDANFRAIALARIAGKSWEELASEFDIVVPTLSSFFQRCCRKFASQMRSSLH